MAVGFIVYKKNLIPDAGIPAITNLVLYIVTPCVIIEAFQRPYDHEMLVNLGIACIAAVGVHVVSILLAHLLIHDKDDSRERVLRFSAVFPNCGYMALPLQLAILGNDGVFYGAAYIAIFNIFSWTYGIVLMGGKQEKISLRKMIINPGIIGVAIGFVLFITQVKLPLIPSQTLHFFSGMNTPLPMIVIGFYLAGITTLSVLADWHMVLAIAFRLILIPIITLFALYFCGIRGTMLVSLVISASSPTAANTVMYATRFNQDTKLSSSAVSISTLISIITMPLIITLALYFSN